MYKKNKYYVLGGDKKLYKKKKKNMLNILICFCFLIKYDKILISKIVFES